MHPFPHRYEVLAVADAERVIVTAPGLPELPTAPPTQFGGPGDQWSPETLLVAAAVDCFILTFRAIAEASKLPWQRLSCSGAGVLDRVEGTTRFTGLALSARLTVAAGVDTEKAKRLLEKAERTCLVTNSLAIQPTLTCQVDVI
jgi:organic hydroperoxide reductase OsmC/OhrA